MIKKEQSWDLMITLNKEDYPVIVKAKPDGGFKVHYISFIVIFHVLVESLAFVDQMYDFAHVFIWLAVACGVSLALLYCGQALHFEWLAKQAARECAGKP